MNFRFAKLICITNRSWQVVAVVCLFGLLPLNVLAQNTGYWENVERKFATTEFGNVAAIAAHNCYVDSRESAEENLKLTLEKIHAAQKAGADLIELDIKQDGSEILVAHDDDSNSNRARLADVLADKELASGDQVLFIEIKEKNPTAKFARDLLQIVNDAKVVRSGRPIVFRAFDDRRRNLLLIKSALKRDSLQHLEKIVRFHEFIRRDEKRTDLVFHSKILQAKNSGFHGVEFRFDAPSVFGGIAYAKLVGLGVGLFTIPTNFGEVIVAGFREDVDALVVDYPIEKSRNVVEAKNGLVFLNTHGLTANARQVEYFRSSKTTQEISFRLSSSPVLELLKPGKPMFGNTMTFGKNRFATLHDADNEPDEGYLVTSNVVFNSLEIPDGATQSILAKSDSGGFVLELHNPVGVAPTLLRYGVYVGGKYVYANLPAKCLSRSRAHFILGAYDADGGVRMWIDGKDTAVVVANAVGEVSQNDSPIVIGADPQGKIDRRYFFDGAIQQVQVQSWGQH